MPLTNLKPVFYRVASSVEVQSGWINSATGDICDTEDGDHYRIRVVPQGRAAFSVGQRIEVRETVPLWDGDCLLGDERGAIASLDEDTGAVEVKLEALHSALEDNTLTLYPFHNEETLACLRLYEAPVVERAVEVERAPSLWWAALVFAIIAPMVAMMDIGFQVHSAMLLFSVTILAASMVLGMAHALILSVLCPLVINVLLITPMGLTAPTAGELFRVAVYLGLSIFGPTLCSKCQEWRRAIVEVEDEVLPQREANKGKEGLN